MDLSPSQATRPVELITSDLEQLAAEPGFIYTFSLMVLEFLWMSTDQVGDVNWHERPNNREMSGLLGFLVKHPVDLSSLPSEETYHAQRHQACSLLEELHLSHAFSVVNVGTSGSSPNPDWTGEFSRAYDQWINSGDGMVESIIYSGAGAYDFQYLEMAAQRYSSDGRWLEEHLGTDYDSVIQTARRFTELAGSRVQSLKPPSSFEEFCVQILAAMSFSSSDLSPDDQNAFDALVDKFALSPGMEDQSFPSIGERNVVDYRPLIELGDGRYFLPLFSNLAEAIYESPFYWMMRDGAYRNTALRHRGDATEVITRNLLSAVFTHGRVYRDVKVKRGSKDVTDIDILALSGNKAVIVQCKSKKLTAKARAGDPESLKTDFLKAVQEPYEQGLAARDALLDEQPALVLQDGRPLRLRRPIDEGYVVCVTGDDYPALQSQARSYLEVRDGDPYPVVMTVFDLDVACFYLADQFEFLYYLRQRSTHAEYYFADSEASVLGFHLRHKLFPDEDYTATFVDPHYAQLIDAHYLGARGGGPMDNSEAELFHGWRNATFDELVRDVKSVADQRPRDLPVEDILFFLYGLAGQGADQLVDAANHCKRRTKLDGKQHDARLPLKNAKSGTTLVSFPKVHHPIQAEVFERDFAAIAKFHKYRSKADEWLALGSFEDSSVAFELFGYMNDPWKYDPAIEQVMDEALVSGKALDAKGRKPESTEGV